MSETPDNPTARAVEEALALLKKERRAFWGRMLLSLGAWGAGLLTFFLALGRILVSDPGGLLTLCLSLGCVIGGAILLPRTRSQAMEKLAALDDLRAIGPLLEALTFAVGVNRYLLTARLTDLLPRLRASDAPLLNQSQRRILYEALSLGDFQQETDLLLAILKALEQIGDAHALPIVTRLASGSSGSKREQQVRAAARACLPFLQAQIKRQRLSETLLRANPSPDAEHELLRAAAATEETAPQQLLRPHEG
jgi:hypothetical protein